MYNEWICLLKNSDFPFVFVFSDITEDTYSGASKSLTKSVPLQKSMKDPWTKRPLSHILHQISERRQKKKIKKFLILAQFFAERHLMQRK